MELKIVSLFANSNEDGIYGDIYNSVEDCLKAHPYDEVLLGFGVMNENTNHLVEESDDFYPTETAAQQFIDKLRGEAARHEKTITCQMERDLSRGVLPALAGRFRAPVKQTDS